MHLGRLLIALVVLGFTSTLASATSLTARWGLQSDFLYEEALEAPGETSVVTSIKSKRRRTVRAFRVREPQHEEAITQFLRRHWALVDLYRSSHSAASGSIPREEFVMWAKQRDPVYVAAGQRLAPVLYFDFVGDSGKQYVLDRIVVRTIRFMEYAGGGGFFDQQAWYDLELSATPGSKTYQVDRKLQFIGKGRAEIRFWSGNYIPLMAMAPIGSYLISVRFIFLVDGEEVLFNTGQFRIDA
jgi:hypothetical protein